MTLKWKYHVCEHHEGSVLQAYKIYLLQFMIFCLPMSYICLVIYIQDHNDLAITKFQCYFSTMNRWSGVANEEPIKDLQWISSDDLAFGSYLTGDIKKS